jgi:hypothetical protein
VVGGKFEPLTFCPGYLRGLAFCGDYAVVGLSQPRQDKTFGGLALDGDLALDGEIRTATYCMASGGCGVILIDVLTRATVSVKRG